MLQKSSDVNICLSSDDNYASCLCICLKSIILSYNSKDERDVNFFVFDGGISNENKKKLQSIMCNGFNLIFIDVDEHFFEDFPLLNDGLQTVATYFRLLIPNVFEGLDRILYLDADIVVRKSIHLLHDKDLSNTAALAVEEPYTLNESRLKDIGMSESSPYFNAGVLLLNLVTLRCMEFERKCLEVKNRYKSSLLYQDQDILNSVLENNWKPLQPRYNSMQFFYREKFFLKSRCYSLYELAVAKANPIIVHYNIHPKPWANGCTDKRDYFYTEFSKNTPFINNTVSSTWTDMMIYRFNPISIKIMIKSIKGIIRKTLFKG